MTANDEATLRELIQWHTEQAKYPPMGAGVRNRKPRSFDQRFHERAAETLEKLLRETKHERI